MSSVESELQNNLISKDIEKPNNGISIGGKILIGLSGAIGKRNIFFLNV